VSLYSRVALGLSVFLGVAGIVYALTARESIGILLLLIASACFGYVGLYVRRAVRAASAEAPGVAVPGEMEEPHIESTIWPFVFSLAGVGLVLGAVLTPWLLVVGAVLFVAAAVGWFRDVGRQWGHGEHR